MRVFSALSFVVLSAFAGAAHAGGGVLTTAPISSTFADSDTVFCQAVNVSTKEITITFEAHSVTGALVDSVTHTLAPGAVNGLQTDETVQYCRFVGASAKAVRAHAVYYDTPNDRYLLAIPAQ